MADRLYTNMEYTDNSEILKEFYSFVSEKYDSIINNLVDVGHRKNIRFTRLIADLYPEKEIIYYDNRDSIQTLTTALKQGLDKILKMWKIRSEKEVPKNITFKSSPKGEFDAASYFFTIHEFNPKEDMLPVESLGKTSRLIKTGGLLFIIDYNLFQIREMMKKDPEEAKETFKNLFNTNNEKEVIEQEKDYLQAHIHYDLEQCIQDAEHVGFKTLHHRPEIGEKSKLFFYIGEKS